MDGTPRLRDHRGPGRCRPAWVLASALLLAGCRPTAPADAGWRWRAAGAGYPARCARFSPDGQTILVGFDGGAVRAYRASDGDESWSLPSGAGDVHAVAWAPVGNLIAIGRADGRVEIRGPAGGLLRTCRGHSGFIARLAFSPAGDRLASASGDGTIRLWDPADGRLLQTLTGHSGTVWGVGFRPDGRELASAGDDGTVRIWDASTGQSLRTPDGLRGTIGCVAYRPDGLQLAAGMSPGEVVIWDARTWVAGPPSKLVQAGMVHDLSFRPDGSRLAAAVSRDDRGVAPGALIEVKLDGSSPPRVIDDPGGWLLTVAYSPDGRRLAAGSRSGAVGVVEGASDPLP